MRLALFPFACLTLLAQNLTPAREAAIGRQVAEEVRRSTTPVESQAVQGYVSQLGARLVAQSPDLALGYTFSVVSTGRGNALHEPLALPGGYVFVPSSLLLAANDEAEFAGMLARAIVRPAYLAPASAGGSPSIPVSTLIDSFDGFARVPHQIQLEADKSAVLTMSRAGFDPAALLRHIERVQPPDQRASALPARNGRIAALRQAIGEIPPATYVDSGEFHGIQDLVRPAARTQPAPSLFR